MEKSLIIHNIAHRIEITSFNYNANRMGGAPAITANVMFHECLDNIWTDKVYVVFNDEKYYLKQTPTSSKNNTDSLYKHECEFVSERIALDNVYFIDAVVGNPQENDKPISNSATFSFFGTIKEFANRLNAAFEYAKLDYRVDVSNLVDGEEKLLSFDKVSLSAALQESYNQFQIPFYFVGKTIRFDYYQYKINETFKYGADHQLLSITKANANQKIVNRCTGTGSSENIPYYYPNEHPQGELIPLYTLANTETPKDDIVSISNDNRFSKILYGDSIVYTSYDKAFGGEASIGYYEIKSFNDYKAKVTNRKLISANTINNNNWFLAPKKDWTDKQKEDYTTALFGAYNTWGSNTTHIVVDKYNNSIAFRLSVSKDYIVPKSATQAEIKNKTFKITVNIQSNSEFFDNDLKLYYRGGSDGLDLKYSNFTLNKVGDSSSWSGEFYIADSWFDQYTQYDKALYFTISPTEGFSTTLMPKIDIDFAYPASINTWKRNSKEYVTLDELGLTSNATPNIGDVISFKQGKYVQPMTTLMPPIYWKSEGAERYYNAENNKYKDEDGNYYQFANPYSDSKRKEHIVEFPDIKPSIENVKNADNEYINSFIEFAFDKNDNDQKDGKGEYIHPYFYGKLRKFNGEFGFNIFDYANEKGEATFSMTSGNCGACNFVLGVNAESGKNDLQVDDDGKLLFENGVAKRGVPQDRQNDTKNNEVWVALKKDANTYGTIMPNATHGYRPAAGDTFVLTNINFPITFIKAAEKRLEAEIIKFMYENNMDKFTFSIKFSRIYLEENPDVLAQLNENALITIEYNNQKHLLYVSSFAYKKDANTALPEITVELAKTLSASHNALQTALAEVRTDVLDSVQKMDVAAMVASKFISSDTEDTARQKITFNRGVDFGTTEEKVGSIDELGNSELSSMILRDYITSPQFVDGFSGSGYKIWLDEAGLSHLTVDQLTVRQQMKIFELLVSKIRAVNGGLWISAANGKIAKVVEQDEYYEITLEETNAFVAGDFIRCQVFSAGEQRFYWVEVSNVDGDRLLVAKSEFNDTMPLVGDDIVLDGSKNEKRQNAIHISASEDGKPRISIYNGISTKSHNGCLRTQLGDLNNIEDDVLKPQGDGLYSDNAYLKGDFILRKSGKDVETQFAITEEGIKSAVGSMQDDMEHGGTILYNPSFTMGESGWITSNVVIYYLFGDSPIFNGGSLVVNNAHENADADYNHRFILNINNGYIKQLNEYFVNKPEFSETTFVPLMFGLKIMVEEDGNLLIYMDGCNANANKVKAFKGYARISSGVDENAYILLGNGKYLRFDNAGGYNNVGDEIIVVMRNDQYELYNATRKMKINYSSVSEEVSLEAYDVLDEPIFFIGYKELTAKEEYLTLEFASEWNGTGNFNLAFTGGASIYSLQLSTDMVEVRHATLFEQTERIISATAAMYGENNALLEKSGIVIESNYAKMFSQQVNEQGLVNEAKVETMVKDGISQVEISADKINLKGYVTNENGDFSIDQEGRMHAKSGTFSGTVNATDGIFNGSIALRFQQLPIGDEVSLSFDTGFNFAGAESSHGVMYQKTIILPSDSSVLNGVKCTIQNTGIGQITSGENIVPYKRFVIKTSNSLPFLHNAMNPYYESNIDTVWIEPARMATFSASIVGGVVRWTIENGEGLSPTQDAPNILRGAGMQQPFVFWAGEISSKADAAGFYYSPYSFFGVSGGVVVSRTDGYDNRFDITFTTPMSDGWVYIPQITPLDTDDRAYIQDITNNGFVLRTGGKVLLTILLLRTAAY